MSLPCHLNGSGSPNPPDIPEASVEHIPNVNDARVHEEEGGHVVFPSLPFSNHRGLCRNYPRYYYPLVSAKDSLFSVSSDDSSLSIDNVSYDALWDDDDPPSLVPIALPSPPSSPGEYNEFDWIQKGPNTVEGPGNDVLTSFPPIKQLPGTSSTNDFQTPESPLHDSNQNQLETERRNKSHSSPRHRKQSKNSSSGKRSIWNEHENKRLRELVKKYGKRHWRRISNEMGTQRSDMECRQHYCRVLDRNTCRGRWKEDEVDRLNQARNDGLDWNQTADFVATRDKAQCKLKWKQLVEKESKQPCFCGDVTHTKLKDEEECLKDLNKECFEDWEKICEMMDSDSTEGDMRHHYRHLGGKSD